MSLISRPILRKSEQIRAQSRSYSIPLESPARRPVLITTELGHRPSISRFGPIPGPCLPDPNSRLRSRFCPWFPSPAPIPVSVGCTHSVQVGRGEHHLAGVLQSTQVPAAPGRLVPAVQRQTRVGHHHAARRRHEPDGGAAGTSNSWDTVDSSVFTTGV